MADIEHTRPIDEPVTPADIDAIRQARKAHADLVEACVAATSAKQSYEAARDRVRHAEKALEKASASALDLLVRGDVSKDASA